MCYYFAADDHHCLSDVALAKADEGATHGFETT
jgi:hypothetical protein